MLLSILMLLTYINYIPYIPFASRRIRKRREFILGTRIENIDSRFCGTDDLIVEIHTRPNFAETDYISFSIGDSVPCEAYAAPVVGIANGF